MVLVLAGLWVGQHVSLLPLDASSNAPVYDSLFQVLFSIGTILFVGVTGLLVFSLVRFRRRAGDQGDGVAIEGNLPLEILWTAIPAVVVLFVGIYSYDIYERMGGMAPLNGHEALHAEHASMALAGMESSGLAPGDTVLAAADAATPQERVWGGIASNSGDALPVELTAMQFAFIFHYPGSSITSGELHVPVGRPVQLRMEARDVIHAFWVPQFRLKQDVIPGQPTLMSFTPTRAGTYPIVCAELCGPYHGGMRTNVVVHEPDDFDTWVRSNAPPSPATVAAAAGPTTG
ncbi:MAG: cytochrome c oxidase subunit II [Synechococcus sp.]